MINRIRDIRRAKRLTLADVAARCSPPTTAQTIGRLETGMRQLSLMWMNRIAAALEVEPELLVRGEAAAQPQYVARLTEAGAEALTAPRDAILPSDTGRRRPAGRAGDRGQRGRLPRRATRSGCASMGRTDFARLLNRDVLAPRSGGRFAFGRLIDRDDNARRDSPARRRQRQVVIDNPAWLAAAEMLVRKL